MYQGLSMNADGNPRFPCLVLCLQCGAYVGDMDVHDKWHNKIGLPVTEGLSNGGIG